MNGFLEGEFESRGRSFSEADLFQGRAIQGTGLVMGGANLLDELAEELVSCGAVPDGKPFMKLDYSSIWEVPPHPE